MKTRLHPGLTAAATLLLLAMDVASAQVVGRNPPPPPRLPEVVAAPAADVADAPEKRFDVELDEGIAAQDAVALIAKKLAAPINVIFTGDSAGTPMPRLRLHQVTLPEFFAAVRATGQIELANGRPGYGFAPVEGAPNIYTFSVRVPADPQSTIHFNLANQGIPGMGGAGSVSPAPAKTSLFFDLSTLLDDSLTIEDLTTAIRTAWTAADGTEPPVDSLRFHKETRLLIATGPPDRLGIVDNIVKLLEARKKPSDDEQSKKIASLKGEYDDVVHRAKQELAESTRQADEAVRQVDRLTKRLEISETEKDAMVRELRTRIAELEIELAKREKKS